MTMFNILKPQHERKHAQQRWLYTWGAFILIILGVALWTQGKKSRALRIAPEVEITIPLEVIETPPKALAEEIFTTFHIEPEAPLVELTKPNPCAHLTPPNHAIAAILLQKHDYKVIFRSSESQFFAMAIGEYLEHSGWQLQSIENSSIVWRHLNSSCAAEQAIKELNKQPFRY